MYKLHYQQLLSVRSIIENYEKSFDEELQKKNISRLEKWKEFLGSEKAFKPFKEENLSVAEVSAMIVDIYKRHSAKIHSVELVEGLLLDTRGLLEPNELTVMKILIENSRWKGHITIAWVWLDILLLYKLHIFFIV